MDSQHEHLLHTEVRKMSVKRQVFSRLVEFKEKQNSLQEKEDLVSRNTSKHETTRWFFIVSM